MIMQLIIIGNVYILLNDDYILNIKKFYFSNSGLRCYIISLNWDNGHNCVHSFKVLNEHEMLSFLILEPESNEDNTKKLRG